MKKFAVVLLALLFVCGLFLSGTGSLFASENEEAQEEVNQEEETVDPDDYLKLQEEELEEELEEEQEEEQEGGDQESAPEDEQGYPEEKSPDDRG